MARIDTELQARLSMPEQQGEEQNESVTVIVRYLDSLQGIASSIEGAGVVELFEGYGIITLPLQDVNLLMRFPEIIYIEISKPVYYNLETARGASCVTGVQGRELQEGASAYNGLTGKGVLVGIVDSGIAISHPAFRLETGESRIRFLWSQEGRLLKTDSDTYGTVPAGYGFGREYTQSELTEVLEQEDEENNLLLFEGTSGHGTAVAGIAAGNGNGSVGQRYRGIAIQSDIIVVQLGTDETGFTDIARVMMGIDYVLRKSLELNMPIVINLSFGTNQGAHDGNTLFEQYLASLNGIGKNSIVIAVGNEGDSRHHAEYRLGTSELTVEFVVGENERRLFLQIWKEYVDTIDFRLISPSGTIITLMQGEEENYQYTESLGIISVYGEPTPFQTRQEIFFLWREADNIENGVWQLLAIPKRIVDGRINLWLPTREATGNRTGFLLPEVNTTLTIPSTARNIISVGAYDAVNERYADFSGRGNTIDGRVAPDLVAPGVDIITTLPENRYGAVTGTSFAAPFVSGCVALMMEWGIVQGNDVFLYGEKMKAYLWKGAKQFAGQIQVPDTKVGWGRICLADSFPESTR